ncbi:hypothetical protein [Candidatus Poriferisodalis sp.]|uniref:hypothetical protein n=1 Tax=Candidatus Poriferisodalis sp. TaxID=3101277 RepID=UPI003D0A25CD
MGAWLAALVASGRVDADALVPEGFEDMSLEGSRPRHVQVKSRQRHLGHFPVRAACGHVLEAWDRHSTRLEDGSAVVVVLERGVVDEDDLNDFDQTLENSLSPHSALRAALWDSACAREMSGADFDDLLSRTVLVGVTWDEVTAGTVAELAECVTLPPSAMRRVARLLRVCVADAVDHNAAASYEYRRCLGRTELVGIINDAAQHIDIDSLEYALGNGICEALEFGNTGDGDDRFYEGTATQPAHVAAGLVVPRPALMDQVLSGLDERSASVITGPSGVGKSAVLWTVPLALPGVLWFRVRRLAEEDVPHLIRLARAYDVNQETPVAFLVDAAGADGLSAWARLRAEASAVPGLLLVASARSEDLMTLGDLSNCATIEVRLDETAAKTIFDGLVRRGVTTAPHWAEALDQADGLTLEFTHLLTRGQRLDDVIGDQIRRRIAEHRHLELDVLSLVSVADRWSAAISTNDVVAACGATVFEVREAISRLADEHLVTEHDGVMSGLHRLRSTAISEAVHAQPPPDILSTIKRVIGLIPTPQIHRFVASLLRDIPAARDVVIDAASAEQPSMVRITACLYGLRLADSYELAWTWKEIADLHEVPASCWTLLFGFTSAGLRLPDFLPAQLREAQQAMEATGGRSSPEALIARVGTAGIADLLSSTGDVDEATQMLAVLKDADSVLSCAVKTTVNESCPLLHALRSAPVNALAECLAAARSCNKTLAESLVELMGGEDAVLRRIRAQNPWITELDVRTEDGNALAFGRFLHVSDAVQDDPREAAVALGQLLLRCLPRIESVNIQALLPGGQEIRINGLVHGISELQREYDHSASATAWNQAQTRVALTLLGETDTVRLNSARPLLGQAADLTYEIGTRLITGQLARRGLKGLTGKIAKLHEGGRSIRPALGTIELGDTTISEQATAITTDDLSALITDLTGNVFRRLQQPDEYRTLAAYIADTVIGKHLEGAINQPWRLLGINGHPSSLDRLRDVLLDIYAVVHEMAIGRTNVTQLAQIARSIGTTQALQRAGDTCRQHEERYIGERRDAVRRACDAAGIRTSIVTRPQEPSVLLDLAITVEIPSLPEWPDAVSTLETALSAQQPIIEAYLLIPLRNGRPIPNLTMRLGSSLYPALDLGEWAALLPDPHPSELADTFTEAHNALQTLSGIQLLPEDQQEHHIAQEAAEAAASQLESAWKRLAELRPDALIETLMAYLTSLAHQIQTEGNGTHVGRSFAEQIALGVAQQEETEHFTNFVGARLLALQWDINAQVAIELLLRE